MSPARILVVDNYDSFVFNLVQYLGQLGAECVVRRNDEVDRGAVVDVVAGGSVVVVVDDDGSEADCAPALAPSSGNNNPTATTNLRTRRT